MGNSTNLFAGINKITHSEDNIEEFQLPFKDISNNLKKDGLYCPGSFLSVSLLDNHPITYGLPSEIGVFHAVILYLQLHFQVLIWIEE